MDRLDDIHIDLIGSSLVTTGMRARGLADLRATLPHPDDVDAVQHVLETLVSYQVEQNVLLRAKEQVRRGYWTVQLHEGPDGVLDLWEVTPDGEEFVPGIASTIRYWVDQVATCQRANADFDPPLANQMAAVSKGVYEGGIAVNGVRYQAPHHMSGWYLFTDLYDGDIKTLQVDHLFHVTERRPDLAKYLALPPGFRFTTWDLGDEITFDAEAALPCE